MSQNRLQLLRNDNLTQVNYGEKRFSSTHRAIGLMLLAQVFASLMSVSIQVLENLSTELHPLQILFFRMSITTVAISVYLWSQNIPDFLFGKRENRVLLMVRAFGGFLGVFGLYSSLRYLDLSEATVITFLMPLVASFTGHVLLKTPFSSLEMIASIVSIVGVLLVASPTSLDTNQSSLIKGNLGHPENISALLRIMALGAGLVGVCGSAAAFLSIQLIGKSENPLIVINYYTALCCVVSMITLAEFPGLGGFMSPATMKEWILLGFSGISGLAMQILITLSLQLEKSFIVVNMVYTQIVFALILDLMVFQSIPKVSSLVGCILICGSAFALAWHKK